jgi:aerobic carbon-monoxide dehydrogenase large subunit
MTSKESSDKRVEDTRLLEGKGNFVDDLKLGKMAYLGLVRSPYAHARIIKIDFSRAKEIPDFVDGITGEDIKDSTAPIFVVAGPRETKRKQLAIGKTRFVGEPVAAFLSRTKYSVEDIIEAIDVEYEELVPVMSIEDSKKADVKVYDEWPDNVFFQNGAKKGDAAKAISSSRNVIRAKIGIKRQAGVPIEPRAYVVEYDKGRDMFIVEATSQRPHGIQNHIACELKIPPSKVHVVVKDVGGGFGTKGAQSYPEPVLACVLAKKTGFSVKAVTTRSEDLLESAAGRDQYCDMELACDDRGRITGFRATLEANVGVSGSLSTSTRNTAQLLPEVYKIPNFEIQAFCYVSNKAPLGPVRGAGRPEAAFFMERAIDIMARHLSMDSLKFRQQNLIQPNELPFDNGAGGVYDSGNFPLLLEKITPKYSEMREWRDLMNVSRNSLAAGVGLCMEVEDTGVQLKETAKVSIAKGGKVTVITGSSPHGQGLETSLAELCARELNVPLQDVSVIYGDTDLIPFGIGTFGSRSISVGGSAVLDASRKVKEEVAKRAAKLAGIQPNEISIKKGLIVKTQHSSSQGTKTVLTSLCNLIEKTGTIEVYSDYALKGMPFASGAHVCALTMDKETGKIKIHRYVAVDDCGTIINSMIVDGQLHGGIVHGIGGSLFEEIVYSEDGQMITVNFLDYTMPSTAEIPDDIELLHVETPSPVTLNGSKGVGESGTIAAYPCVFNALNDALARAGSDARLNIAPAFPEQILRALSPQ